MSKPSDESNDTANLTERLTQLYDRNDAIERELNKLNHAAHIARGVPTVESKPGGSYSFCVAQCVHEHGGAYCGYRLPLQAETQRVAAPASEAKVDEPRDPFNRIADSLEYAGFQNVVADGPLVTFYFSDHQYEVRSAEPLDEPDPQSQVSSAVAETLRHAFKPPPFDVEDNLCRAVVKVGEKWRQCFRLEHDPIHLSDDIVDDKRVPFETAPCPFKAGDRVRFKKEIRGSWPEATVTDITERGFRYEYDEPFVLGTRIGSSLGGEAYASSFKYWELVAQPELIPCPACEGCGQVEAPVRGYAKATEDSLKHAKGESVEGPQAHEMIRSAAVRKNGIVYPCFAHAYLEIKRMNHDFPEDGFRHCEQGFVTNTGRYVDRVEGLAIAQAANQIIHKHHPLHELDSSDLRERPSDPPAQQEPPERIWIQYSPDGSLDNRFIWTKGDVEYARVYPASELTVEAAWTELKTLFPKPGFTEINWDYAAFSNFKPRWKVKVIIEARAFYGLTLTEAMQAVREFAASQKED